MNIVAAQGVTDGPSLPVGFDESPPGERYFRHPGDVLDVVLSAAALLVLIAFIHVSTGTSAGVRADLGQAATSAPRAAASFSWRSCRLPRSSCPWLWSQASW